MKRCGALVLFDRRCESCNEDGFPLCVKCEGLLLDSAIPDVITLRKVEIRAASFYEGVARDLVLVLKQRRSHAVASKIGEVMIERLEMNDFEVVSWAPTSNEHVRERGHDQARLIAAAVARHLGVRLRRTLRRVGHSAQTGKSRRDRLNGPTFEAAPSVVGHRILLIDDVVTTGATLTSAHECLTSRGASVVACVAFASTPDPTRIR